MPAEPTEHEKSVPPLTRATYKIYLCSPLQKWEKREECWRRLGVKRVTFQDTIIHWLWILGANGLSIFKWRCAPSKWLLC